MRHDACLSNVVTVQSERTNTTNRPTDTKISAKTPEKIHPSAVWKHIFDATIALEPATSQTCATIVRQPSCVDRSPGTLLLNGHNTPYTPNSWWIAAVTPCAQHGVTCDWPIRLLYEAWCDGFNNIRWLFFFIPTLRLYYIDSHFFVLVMAQKWAFNIVISFVLWLSVALLNGRYWCKTTCCMHNSCAACSPSLLWTKQSSSLSLNVHEMHTHMLAGQRSVVYLATFAAIPINFNNLVM